MHNDILNPTNNGEEFPLPVVKEKVTDKETVLILKFENGVYHAGNDLFPRMVISLPYTFNRYDVKAEIVNTVFENIGTDEVSAVIGDLPSEVEAPGLFHNRKAPDSSSLFLVL